MEPLAPQPAQRLPQRLGVAPDDVRPELTVGTGRVAVVAEPLRQVEHHGHGQRVVLLRQLDQGLAVALLHAGGVDDGHAATRLRASRLPAM